METVTLPVNDSLDENEAWGYLTLENFLNGYSEQDAAYEHYDE